MYRAAIFVFALAGIARADDSDAPIHVHNGHATVILHSNPKTIDLAVGDNDIGKPRSFICKSAAGCVVVMAATVHIVANFDQTTTCSFVDGISGVPNCTFDTNSNGDDRFTVTQQSRVLPGLHSIQTKVTTNAEGDQLVGWAFEYTIYERKVKGAD